MMLLETGFSDSLSRVEYSAISVDVGTQILAALIVGLITAFAFQMLLTSLGLAIGITALGFRTIASTNDDSLENTEENPEAKDLRKPSNGQGNTFSKISIAAGLSLLATIDTVLFAASFLAVKVTQVANPISGALVGLVIWSAYFLILLWISSIAISSIAGSILDLATTGVRRLFGAIGSAFTQSKDTQDTQTDMQTEGLLTEGAAIALIRQETALSLASVRPIMEEYFKAIVPPQPDLATLQRDLLDLVKDELPVSKWRSGDRLRLVELIQQRTGFSESDADQLVGQLESHWQEPDESTQPLPSAQELASELLSVLKSTSPEKIKVDQLGAQLEQSFDENPSRVSQLSRWLNLPKIDFKHLLQQALSQVDFEELLDASGLQLSDIQLEDIQLEDIQLEDIQLEDIQLEDIQLEDVWQHFQSLQQRFQGKSELATAESDPAIDPAVPERIIHLRQKLESYLRYTNPQKLTPERVGHKLEQLLEETKVSLPEFEAADWTALLDRRKSLTQPQRQQVVARLAEVWQGASANREAKHLKISKPKTLQLPDSLPDLPIQPTLESLFAKVSGYLDSLNPPSVNELFDEQRIQQILDRLLENPKFSLPGLGKSVQSALAKGSPLAAVKTALKAPQAAMQVLPDRLDQWSQELFTQLLSELTEGLPQSRQLLSEALPQPFLIQATKLRDRLLQQLEELQQQAQRQLDELQQQTQRRIEETRRVAAIAAWWLFFTAFSAACSAAIAGALGVEFLKIK